MKAEGLRAIEAEMARQGADAAASVAAAGPLAARIAARLRARGRVLLLGMGGSHAVGRAVEPLYRAAGIAAVAIPLSEQLVSPLPVEGWAALVTSQSGESGEVVRWFREGGAPADTFGLTLADGSTLAQRVPCLIGAGGPETAFAATRSLTITLAQHLAILAALGTDPGPALAALAAQVPPPPLGAIAALAGVGTVVTTGRALRGLAEAIALGVTELSRRPAFALDGGQLRHGPMEMLGPEVGVLAFRADEAMADQVGELAAATAAAGSPTVILDASGRGGVPGALHLAVPRARGMAAILGLLPLAQTLMLGFAAARVADLGIPLRSTKITQVE